MTVNAIRRYNSDEGTTGCKIYTGNTGQDSCYDQKLPFLEFTYERVLLALTLSQPKTKTEV